MSNSHDAVMMTYLVFFGDLAEGDSLSLDEALEGLNVTTTTNQFTLVLGETSVVLDGRITGELFLVL